EGMIASPVVCLPYGWENCTCSIEVFSSPSPIDSNDLIQSPGRRNSRTSPGDMIWSRYMNTKQKQSPPGFLTVLVSLLATVFVLMPPVCAEVLWRGDFETGTTEQWRGVPRTDSVKVVTDPVREGKYALRIDGTNAARRGDRDRIELQHQPQPP